MSLESKDLELGETVIKYLKSADYSDHVASNLEVKSEKSTDSSVLGKELETKSSQRNVVNIYSETRKEGEVRKIDAQTHSKVETARKNINSRTRQQFTTALGKIKNFDKNHSGLFSRGRSSRAANSQIQKLSVEEKKAISDFFERFEFLGKEQSSFFSKLSSFSGDVENDRLVKDVCLPCIPQDLKKIGWNNSELNIFEQETSFKPNRISPYIYYEQKKAIPTSNAKSSWGNWGPKKHPYYEFFSSENEWLKYVEEINQAWTSYYSYMNSASRRATSVFTLGLVGSRDKDKLERRISDSKASLELAIGTKLMKLMKQLV